MSQLELKEVTKRFGEVIAVNRLSLQVEKGECFTFLGPSGCGKTTTLRMIAGFEDLDEGELLVEDSLYSSSYRKFYVPPEKREFGMVFQAFAVWPHLTVKENVAFPLRIKHRPSSEIESRVKMALTSTNLMKFKDSYPGRLSGGEQQRIALARAIAINPKVMLLDEPLSNLDAKLREEMRFEIKALQNRFGFTVIYVTHDQAEAMALSDRMLVMNYGVVQQVGKPLDIYNKPANRFVFSFIGLSNFIPVMIKEGDAFIERTSQIASHNAPRELGPRAIMACRPSDITFVPISEIDDEKGSLGVQALVIRRTYLGDIVDLKVKVGSVDLRIQKNARSPCPREGESCRIRFNKVLWYPEEYPKESQNMTENQPKTSSEAS